MRKFYNEYFYIPKHGKIRDKVFSARITFLVCIVLLLVTAMGFTAYAYFSASVDVNVSDVTAGLYELDYTIKDASDLLIEPNSDGSYLLDAGTYYVSVTKKDIENSIKTGFCIVDINGTKYHTMQIGLDVNATDGERETLTFTLEVLENAQAEVNFAAHWGTSSNYGYVSEEATDDTYIVADEVITVEAEEEILDLTEDNYIVTDEAATNEVLADTLDSLEE